VELPTETKGYPLVPVARDESGSDRIIPLPHSHPYFFVGCGAERILHRCGFIQMSDMVRSRIGCGVDAD
jgi:hypothetical protein